VTLEAEFYMTAYSERVQPFVEQAGKSVAQLLQRPQASLSEIIAAVANRAYSEGLRDGFTQGVAAESKRRSG
jgi:hypothetical protein